MKSVWREEVKDELFGSKKAQDFNSGDYCLCPVWIQKLMVSYLVVLVNL